jgi:adenylate cyclase
MLGLHQTRALLKQFHDCVAEAVERAAGVVLTFMGDGAMVAFGLPSPKETDAAAALSAALYLRKAVHGIVADFRSEGPVELRVRIGVHLGPVIVSRLGHAKHQQITASGDTVNVASRLMEVAKEYRTAIVVSGELFAKAVASGLTLGSDRFSPEQSICIRGRSQPLSVRLWLDPAQQK